MKSDHVRTDAELVVLCLNGQKDMFDLLIKRYYQPVFSYIYSKVSDKHIVEDIVQETFFATFNSLARCTQPEGFSNWLFAIARNQTLLKLRDAKQPIRTWTKLGISERDKSHIPSAVPEVDSLKEALQSLSEEQQLVLSMKYHNNMSCQEIANALQKPIGTVTSILARAYQTLKNEMKARR